MYSNKFVVSLKSEGKVLREQNGAIRLPFGSEYSIMLKNMESRTAVVNVDIDGDDVLDGQRLVLKPNASLELEGFMRGQTAKNKFKFIKRTRNIEDNRGIHIDDGLIRVEFTFEKMKPIVRETITKYRYYDDWYFYRPYYPYYYEPIPIPQQPWRITWNDNTSGYSGEGACFSMSGGAQSDLTDVQVSYTANAQGMGETVMDSALACNDGEEPGITTKGAPVNQEFSSCWTDDLESQAHSIVLKLVGYNKKGNIVKKPIFTKDKIKCAICGRSNTSANKYCPGCGTYLE